MPRAAEVLLCAALAAPIGASADAQTCTREQFEAVVGEAAAALRTLNQSNKPEFQAKLRQLKDKRGWTYDQFLAEAAPIVQDATIATYDAQSSELLVHIERLGAEGAQAATPDCKRLDEVHQTMQKLVDVQKEKWAYMFKKVQDELGK